MTFVGGVLECVPAALHLLAEQREVVVVPEVVGEVVRVIGEGADHLTVGIPDQAQLVPEVLDPLSQLVEVRDAGLLLRGAQAPASTPIAAMEPGGDQVPAVAVERQVVEARPASESSAAAPAIVRSIVPSS